MFDSWRIYHVLQIQKNNHQYQHIEFHTSKKFVRRLFTRISYFDEEAEIQEIEGEDDIAWFIRMIMTIACKKPEENNLHSWNKIVFS